MNNKRERERERDRSKAESITVAYLNDVEDLLPLLERGVDTSGVVGARMQQDDRARRCCRDVTQHSLEIQAASRRVVVRILVHLDSLVGEDCRVVACREFEHEERDGDRYQCSLSLSLSLSLSRLAMIVIEFFD